MVFRYEAFPVEYDNIAVLLENAVITDEVTKELKSRYEELPDKAPQMGAIVLRCHEDTQQIQDINTSPALLGNSVVYYGK